MNRKTKPHTRAIVTGGTTKSHSPAGFDEVLALIEATRSRVVTAVNTALIDLYWRIGQYISRKIVEEGWGQGTVTALAEYIRGTPAQCPRIFRQQSLADDAVLPKRIAAFQNSHRWCEFCRGHTTS